MRRYPGISPSDSLGRKLSPARFRRTQRQSLGQRELYSCPRPPGGVPSGRPRPSSKGGASLAPPHTDPKHSPAGRPHEEPDGQRDEERAAASCARADFDRWAHGSLQKGPPCARASGDLTSGTVSTGGGHVWRLCGTCPHRLSGSHVACTSSAWSWLRSALCLEALRRLTLSTYP